MYNSSPKEWAELVFGKANLGDPRRTRRLTKIAEDIALNSGDSLVKASGDNASIEGAYRFIRNENIGAGAIAQSGFEYTCSLVKKVPVALAIQDTTGLSFRHSLSDELGNVSSADKTSKSPKGRTLYAHSTLMLDANNEKTIGLSHQKYWFRDEKVKGTKEQQQNRLYEEKESYKWKECFIAMKKQMGDISNIIDVCDREADIYEYLDYHQSLGHRFVVRANENRRLLEPLCNLKELLGTSPAQCCYTVDIKQRAGRKARQAQMALSYQAITLAKPKRSKDQSHLQLNLIICQEQNSEHGEPLCWILYTSEDIHSAEDALRIVRYYELRWRIEEFHKVWKSDGTNVEALRLQSLDNFKRLAVIQAFIATRLLQLQEVAQNREEAKSICCSCYVKGMTWRLLWMKTEKDKPIPNAPPSLHWFYYSIAKLGGWYDSKRNGRVGVKALWKGWLKLAEMVESAEMLKSLQQTGDL